MRLRIQGCNANGLPGKLLKPHDVSCHQISYLKMSKWEFELGNQKKSRPKVTFNFKNRESIAKAAKILACPAGTITKTGCEECTKTGSESEGSSERRDA